MKNANLQFELHYSEVNKNSIKVNPHENFYASGPRNSGITNSIILPLVNQYLMNGFSGIFYEGRGSNTNEKIAYLADKYKIDQISLNFDSPQTSIQLNPLEPEFISSIQDARLLSEALVVGNFDQGINYFLKGTIDLLTATIWYLKKNIPHHCTLPDLYSFFQRLSPLEQVEILKGEPESFFLIKQIEEDISNNRERLLKGVYSPLMELINETNHFEAMYPFMGKGVPVFYSEIKTILTIQNNDKSNLSREPLIRLVFAAAFLKAKKYPTTKKFFVLDCPQLLGFEVFSKIISSSEKYNLGIIASENNSENDNFSPAYNLYKNNREYFKNTVKYETIKIDFKEFRSFKKEIKSHYFNIETSEKFRKCSRNLMLSLNL